MAKRKRSSYKLGKTTSRAIYLACRSGIRREMRRRASRPKKKNVKAVMPKIWNTGCEPARCWMWYNVDIKNMGEYDFMVQNGMMLDFENDDLGVTIEKQKANKEMLVSFRNEVAYKEQCEKETEKMLSIITLLGMVVLAIIL
jgi:cytidylate kinase